MSDYKLHAVVIKKPITLDNAKEISKNFIPINRNFYHETEDSYRFRNIPKQDFIKDSFRTKVVNQKISLIYGKIK